MRRISQYDSMNLTDVRSNDSRPRTRCRGCLGGRSWGYRSCQKETYFSFYCFVKGRCREEKQGRCEGLREKRERCRICSKSSVCTKTRRWRYNSHHRQLVRSELDRTNLRNSRRRRNHPIMVRHDYSFGGLGFHLIRLIRNQRSPDQSLMISRVIILTFWSLIDQQDVIQEARWYRATTFRPYMVIALGSEGGPRLKCRTGSTHRLEHISTMEIE
jgi:hypothetical protein